MSSAHSQSSRAPRRRYVVDAQQQLPAILALVGVCGGCAVLMAGAGFAFSGATVTDMTSTQAGRLALFLDLFYFVAVAAGVAYVGVRFTHRVVGPSMVLTRAIRQILHGDFTGRLDLRDHDYLQDVSAALKDLSHSLRNQHAKQRVFHRQMAQFLEDGDFEAAKELNERKVQDGSLPVIVEPEAAPVETHSEAL